MSHSNTKNITLENNDKLHQMQPINAQTHYEIQFKTQHILLTKRQAQCLFYLLHGGTAKETAEMIGISARTVEIYLNQIRNKTSCFYKNDIIKKMNIIDFLANYPWKDRNII